MPKIRVHELAKQLNVSSKEIISRLNRPDASISNFSSLSNEDVERLKKHYSQGRGGSGKNVGGQTADSANEEAKPLEGRLIKSRPPAESGDKPPEGDTKSRQAGEDGRPIPLGPDGQPLRRRPVGEDGRPIPLGPDGQPLRRRPRPIGEDGKPLPQLGPDGQPLKRRPRPLGEDGRPLPPLGPDGQPLKRRPRPLGEDGRPIPPLGPDGRPLRPRPAGEDGRPLPPLGPDGQPMRRRPRPLGPDGRPLPPVGRDGRPLRPRPVDENGRPLGRDGKPLKPRPIGQDGRPLRPRPAEEDSRSQPATTGDSQPAAADIAASPPNITPSAEHAAQAPINVQPARVNTADSQPVRTGSPRPDREGRPPGDMRQRPGADGRPAPRPRTSPDGRPIQDNRPRPDGTRPSRPPRPDGTRPPYENRPRPDGTRPPYENRPRPDGTRPNYGPRPDGARPPYENRPRPDGTRPSYGPRTPGPRGPGGPGAGGRGPGGPPGRGPAGGPPRPGAPRGPIGRTDVKKTDPTKDERKAQWGKSQEARTAKKDRKDTYGKENRQGLDRRGRSKPAPVKKLMPKVERPVITEITVAPEITIRDLAEKLYRSNADIIKILMKKGVMVTANQLVDFDTATMVAETFNVLVEEYVEVDAFEAAFESEPDDEINMEPRPPVVVVMGHVDHGKTSLLDAIRSENVQASEAGGITQHIGAYSTSINDKTITFLDTPGHEAFTAMRMRGAQVTDIAILVVAADDGVMPQTIEAINHAKAAGIEIIVAINKMDKPGANPDRVKQELVEHGLQSEDWGGETITVPVSALQRTGIDQLLEMILLVAEMRELRANPNKPARGSIIEAKLDKGRGPVATVLVQSGTLRTGDSIVAGACYGKVRAMTDSRGRSLKEAGPSTPVEIIGLAEVPVTGDILYTALNDKQARQLSETVVAKGRVSMIKATQGKVSLDDLFSQIQAGQVKDLNIVVKADVQGSVEALRGSLDKLTNEEVRVRIIHTGVGAINESDVMLASASNAIIIGFNVRPDPSAKSTAESESVDIRTYSVIYSAIDDITAAMKGMLDPEFIEKVIGNAEIRQIFKASSIGTIAGCYITDGKVTRNAQVRIVRDGRVIYDGHLDTLRRFKDDAREVNTGYECGMVFKNYSDIKEGDKIEAYIMEEVPR